MNCRLCYAGIVSTVSFLYGSKYISARCLSSVKANTSTNSQNVSSQFADWTNKWFTDVDIPTPMFAISGKNVKILTSPDDFYQELLVSIYFVNFHNIKDVKQFSS